jgi:hypothetical protein
VQAERQAHAHKALRLPRLGNGGKRWCHRIQQRQTERDAGIAKHGAAGKAGAEVEMDVFHGGGMTNGSRVMKYRSNRPCCRDHLLSCTWGSVAACSGISGGGNLN